MRPNTHFLGTDLTSTLQREATCRFVSARFENRDWHHSKGRKFLGEVVKIRGLGSRILRFGELAPSKIKSIEDRLSYLEDAYMLRNVLALLMHMQHRRSNMCRLQRASASA